MTPLLRDLIWATILAAIVIFCLDMTESNQQLQTRVLSVKRIVERQENISVQTNWSAVDQQARKAQADWIELLPPVTSAGKFRAEALESLGDLCNSLEAACRLSAQGESTEGDELPRNSNSLVGLSAATGASANTNSGASVGPGATTSPNASAISATRARAIPLVVTASKLTVPIQTGKLTVLLEQIESGRALRVIDKLSVRGINAELNVKSYGLEAQDRQRQLQALGAP